MEKFNPATMNAHDFIRRVIEHHDSARALRVAGRPAHLVGTVASPDMNQTLKAAMAARKQ